MFKTFSDFRNTANHFLIGHDKNNTMIFIPALQSNRWPSILKTSFWGDRHHGIKDVYVTKNIHTLYFSVIHDNIDLHEIDRTLHYQISLKHMSKVKTISAVEWKEKFGERVLHV